MIANDACKANIKMSFESICSTPPVRLLFAFVRIVISIADVFKQGMVTLICHKFREVFSLRVNRILLNELVTHNRRIYSALCRVESIELRTSVPCCLSLDLKDYTQGDFYFAGFPDFTVNLLYYCNDETLFFDIGANGGLVSLALSRFLPHSNIFAFEPVLSTFQRLRQNLQDNCASAKAVNVALSSLDGTLRMVIPDTDSGSATASTAPADLMNLHGCETRTTVNEVKCMRFDSYFAEYVVVQFESARRFAFKIDVEGHEIETLRGMSEFLSRTDIAVFAVVEVRRENGLAVHELLSSFGMKPHSNERSAERINGHHSDCIYIKEPVGSLG